ncbi:hypothetical protein [uncultured Roseibium sp.]|uniref:hypothetical protein n=1 Tax=uncultured Roseibium sp. TaxID=1936171 RepID=UPI003216519F
MKKFSKLTLEYFVDMIRTIDDHNVRAQDMCFRDFFPNFMTTDKDRLDEDFYDDVTDLFDINLTADLVLSIHKYVDHSWEEIERFLNLHTSRSVNFLQKVSFSAHARCLSAEQIAVLFHTWTAYVREEIINYVGEQEIKNDHQAAMYSRSANPDHQVAAHKYYAMTTETNQSTAQISEVCTALPGLSKGILHTLLRNTKTDSGKSPSNSFAEVLKALVVQTRALQASAKYAEWLIDKHSDASTPFWVEIEKDLEITRENSTYAIECIRPFRKALPKVYDRLVNAKKWEAEMIGRLIDIRSDRRIRSATQARIYCRSAFAEHRSQGLRYLTAGQNNTRRAQRVMNG